MDVKVSDIIKQALVNMGYRAMKDNHWGKPMGYGLVIAEIKDDTIDFSTLFTSHQNKTEQWGHCAINVNLIDGNDEEMYNKCVYRIAYAEYNAGADLIVKKFHPRGKTFDFKT